MASSTPAGREALLAVTRELKEVYDLSRNAELLLFALLVIAASERGGQQALVTIQQFATDFTSRIAIRNYLNARSAGPSVAGATLLHMLVDRAFFAPLIQDFAARRALTRAYLRVFDTFIDT